MAIDLGALSQFYGEQQRERDAKTFCIDGLKEHYDLSTTDAIYVKNLLDKDKERG